MDDMSDDVIDENAGKPAGADFFVALPDGHKVWFKDLSTGQRMMLVRSGEIAEKQGRLIEAGGGTDAEKIRARHDLITRNNKHLWDAIDASMIDKDDIELVMDAMISGEIDVEWAWLVFNRGVPLNVVDDDVEAPPPARKARPVKKSVPAKKAANAKRTQVR